MKIYFSQDANIPEASWTIVRKKSLKGPWNEYFLVLQTYNKEYTDECTIKDLSNQSIGTAITVLNERYILRERGIALENEGIEIVIV